MERKFILTKKTIPAISVIIPMYNTEKYIGECLESLRVQTFQDFEVIVVDDCSTDNSCAVVESYIPKFKGKLKLIRSEVNSGGAGIPRNIGLGLSLGEYIFLMDSDDAILPGAFNMLYKTAVKFKADVVHCDNCYRAPGETVTTDKKLLQERIRIPDTVKEPAVLSDDLAVRIKRFIGPYFMWEPWNHLISRDLIMINNIKFSNLCVADDLMFSIFILCLAEKLVLIPDSFYIWRVRENSNSREKLPVEKKMHRSGGDIIRGIELIEKFTGKIDFFKKYPEYKYALFNFWAKYGGNVLELYSQIPAFKLDGLVRNELQHLEDKTALSAFLFSRMNVLNLNVLQQQNIIRQQQAQIQQLQSQLQQRHG